MSSTDCIFCKIAAGQIPCYKIFENDAVLAFLDINPISDGHTIVIPKVHYERVDQCPAEILAEAAKTLGHLAKAVTSAVNAPAFNVLCNNGSPAGQVVKHIHFHIIPRRENDKVFTQWPKYTYPDGKAPEILKKILAQL
jgi:histidine triad (HIT) family protein